MENPEVHLSPDDYPIRTRELIENVSDNLIRTNEYQILKLNELGKLSLWITGISSAIELYFLSQLDKTDFSTCTAVVFFSSISVIAGINAFLGLLAQLRKIELMTHFLELMQNYGYQKSQMLLHFGGKSELNNQIVKDLEENTAINKISKLQYIDVEIETPNKKIKRISTFLSSCGNYSSILLVIQILLSVSFYIYLTYQ